MFAKRKIMHREVEPSFCNQNSCWTLFPEPAHRMTGGSRIDRGQGRRFLRAAPARPFGCSARAASSSGPFGSCHDTSCYARHVRSARRAKSGARRPERDSTPKWRCSSGSGRRNSSAGPRIIRSTKKDSVSAARKRGERARLIHISRSLESKKRERVRDDRKNREAKGHARQTDRLERRKRCLSAK